MKYYWILKGYFHLTNYYSRFLCYWYAHIFRQKRQIIHQNWIYFVSQFFIILNYFNLKIYYYYRFFILWFLLQEFLLTKENRLEGLSKCLQIFNEILILWSHLNTIIRVFFFIFAFQAWSVFKSLIVFIFDLFFFLI